VSRQATVAQKDGDVRVVRSAVEQLAKLPPKEVQGRKVQSFLDYSDPGKRPAWLGKTTMLEFNLEGGVRLLVRPSGTEPKLKIYSDLCRPFEMGHDLWQQLEDGNQEADAVAVALRDQMKL
jgi:phosphomannomutase